MKQKKKKAMRITIIALVVCILSAFLAGLVQKDFGKIEIRDVRWETDSGHYMSALLLIPENARKTPAPAIITSHGWYNNREMQDLNYIEFARRGFVTMSIDMYGHGYSETLKSGEWFKPENNANGMYDAVKYMSRLPFVDKRNIGVTGHSNGAHASRVAVLLDEEAEEPLIKAALLVSNDAFYYDDDGEFYNQFGNRDAGIIACQYDEFFHRVREEGKPPTPPREFINQVTAQSFLHFGQNPEGLDHRESYQFYKQDMDGREALRVIYNPAITHPWAHFSKHCVIMALDFFDASLNAPLKIAHNKQIWQWKAAFNGIGLVSFVVFAVYFTLSLLETPYFATLNSSEPFQLKAFKDKKEKKWFWLSNLYTTLFSMFVYIIGFRYILKIWPQRAFPQGNPFYIGVWSALCGLFIVLMLYVGRKYRAPQTESERKSLLKENGVSMSKGSWGKTILLALIVVSVSYTIVFLTTYLFKTDFRFWVLTLKAFDSSKLSIILRYLPFFLIYYIANSIAVNSFNAVKIGKKEWHNTLVLGLLNAASPLISILIFYTTFFSTGLLPCDFLPWFGASIIGIWLYPVAVILFVAVFVTRAIYKKTKNPYLGALIMALLVTIMTCTNTLTQF